MVAFGSTAAGTTKDIVLPRQGRAANSEGPTDGPWGLMYHKWPDDDSTFIIEGDRGQLVVWVQSTACFASTRDDREATVFTPQEVCLSFDQLIGLSFVRIRRARLSTSKHGRRLVEGVPTNAC